MQCYNVHKMRENVSLFKQLDSGFEDVKTCERLNATEFFVKDFISLLCRLDF